MEDFERYIMTNPELSPMFTDAKDRVRIDSVTIPSTTDQNPSAHYVNVNRGTFVTSQ